MIKLNELAVYFVSRFAGNSSLSIFAVIDALYIVDNQRLMEWVRGCSMTQPIFNAWCEGFITRLESDDKIGKHARTYLRELWSLVTHYQEFMEQFYEVTEYAEVPQETINQYNRLVMEYNSFVQRFREYIGKLRTVGKTEIEPPSVKLAKELPLKRFSQPEPKQEKKVPNRDEHKGYIM